jgi:hypothetical protein
MAGVGSTAPVFVGDPDAIVMQGPFLFVAIARSAGNLA